MTQLELMLGKDFNKFFVEQDPDLPEGYREEEYEEEVDEEELLAECEPADFSGVTEDR